MPNSTKNNFLLLPFVFFVLTGCGADVANNGREPMLTPDIAQATLTPTESIAPTTTLRATNTIVSVAPAKTPTADVLPVTPTPLPTATLTREQISENLADLMESNGGCQIPCWWGIVPGKSQFEPARESLASRGFNIGEDRNARVRLGDLIISTAFNVEEGIVHSVKVVSDKLFLEDNGSEYVENWQRYSLPEVLNRYGIPTQVFVYSPFQADPGGSAYHLIVFYEDLGFEIEYEGTAEQLNGYHYRACPDLTDTWSIGLFLYQPGQIDNVVERILPPSSISYIGDAEDVYGLISWQHATGTSLEYFYETLSISESNACFEFMTERISGESD